MVFRLKNTGLAFFIAALFLTGCGTNSYPGDKLKESIIDICKKEYGIDNVDVKVVGTTIGVYLPLKKLFAADFKEAAITGKVRSLESLFEPAPEALEKVEDVLFAISRVLLSTDRPLEFYSLQATDVEKTGMQLVLSGNVNDIKRVRIWDISRNEYRKRIVHELRLNRPARWHDAVRIFFHDLETLPAKEVQAAYFGNVLPIQAMKTLFFDALVSEENPVKPRWEILNLKSIPVQKNQVLVYAQVKPHHPAVQLPEEQLLQYLFMLSLQEEQVSVVRIIPFQFRDNDGKFQKIPFPKELQIEDNLENWEEEFKVEKMSMGPFLAEQLNRRIQTLVSSDERIINTFRDLKLDFQYEEVPAPAHFSLSLEAPLSDFNNYNRESVVYHDDMLYLLNLISREFVTVLRSYNFGAYDHLRLKLSQEPTPWIIPRNSLELFRQNKETLQGLFSLSKI